MPVVTANLNQSVSSESTGCKAHVVFPCLVFDSNDFVDIFQVVYI